MVALRKDLEPEFELTNCNDSHCHICYDDGIEYTAKRHQAWEKQQTANTDRKIEAQKQIKSLANDLMKMQLGRNA